jgi:uncharacterized membrane protein (UPF0127 family)
MKSREMLLTALLLGSVLTGCGPSPGPVSGEATSGAASPPVVSKPATAVRPPAMEETEVILHLDRAQVNLPRVQLYVGPHEISAELATTVTEVATGLMFREGMRTNDAMLFVFALPQQRSFYMKNVPFPIAAGYIDSEGILQEVVQLKAQDPTPVPSKSDRIQFVLETDPGWFERNGVGVGTLLTTPDGPLKTTLARRAKLR